MPNHVTTRCTLQGSPEDIAAFMELMIGEGKEHGEKVEKFDFERIIPMPGYMRDIESSTRAEHYLHIVQRDAEMQRSWEWMDNWYKGGLGPFAATILMSDDELQAAIEAVDPNAWSNAQAMIRAKRETGHVSWYDWSIDNWGTKWNAYGFKRVSAEPCVFMIDTAWSPPVPVFEALAKRFPNLGIHCVSFDEGWGFACEGWFNPPEGESEYAEVEPDDETYEKVYGSAPEKWDNEGEESDKVDSAVETEQPETAEKDGEDEDSSDKPIWSA